MLPYVMVRGEGEGRSEKELSKGREERNLDDYLHFSNKITNRTEKKKSLKSQFLIFYLLNGGGRDKEL